MNVEDRLSALERSNRRLRSAVGVALGLAALATGFALLKPAAGSASLTVQELRLVDADGVERARLGAQSRGFGLAVNDGLGRPRALLGTTEEGSPQLRFASPEGQTLAELLVYAAGAPKLSLAQPGGADFFSVSLHVDGSSRLELADVEGKPRAILAAGHDGSPGLVLVDRRGTPRAELSITGGDAPVLWLEGKNGNVFRAPQ